MNTKTERIARYFHQMEKRGFDYNEASQLRRIELTLSRWAERECGDGSGCIERDETTGKPYWLSATSRYVDPRDPRSRYAIPDREKGALRRLAAIMARHPDFIAYHQSDPRGCALYLVAKSDMNGFPIDQVYTRGLAVCY